MSWLAQEADVRWFNVAKWQLTVELLTDSIGSVNGRTGRNAAAKSNSGGTTVQSSA